MVAPPRAECGLAAEAALALEDDGDGGVGDRQAEEDDGTGGGADGGGGRRGGGGRGALPPAFEHGGHDARGAGRPEALWVLA